VKKIVPTGNIGRENKTHMSKLCQQIPKRKL